MSTKYGVSPRSRWVMQGNPRMTDHAADRWDERMPPHSVAPETAFEQALDVSEIRENVKSFSGDVPDETHYFYEPATEGSYSALFLVSEGVIKTVYSPEEVRHGPTRAYLDAHKPHFHGEDL